MQAIQPNGSADKATTTPLHLQARAIVGGALIGFLVMKTPEARERLELLANQPGLTESDAAVIAAHLAKPIRINTPLEA